MKSAAWVDDGNGLGSIQRGYGYLLCSFIKDFIAVDSNVTEDLSEINLLTGTWQSVQGEVSSSGDGVTGVCISYILK